MHDNSIGDTPYTAHMITYIHHSLMMDVTFDIKAIASVDTNYM